VFELIFLKYNLMDWWHQLNYSDIRSTDEDNNNKIIAIFCRTRPKFSFNESKRAQLFILFSKMGDFYDGYYEATEGDDVVVHLAYSEPEPSLLRVASKKGSSRPQLKVPGTIKRSSFRTSASSRSFKNRLDADQSVYSGGDKTHPLLPDDRDDIYETQIQRVNIQDQRHSSGSIVFKATRDGTKSIDSSLSSPSAKAVDLSTKGSDTSFDLFANLLIEHLTPKVKNRFYILEEDDIAYIDAILPNSLRLSFVNAVNVRMSKIDIRLPEPDLPSLQKNVLGVYRLGLGKPKQDNFLLGGGQKLHGGKIKMNLIDHDDFVQDDRDTNDLTDKEMSELIKSLDDLKDEEIAWLKDSGLSREQSFMLENAMALRRAAPSMKTKRSNMQLAGPRDSEVNVTKSIREIPCDQFNDIDMIVNPISSYREGENEWKDGMFSIFAHGVFHPFLILTWCAPICKLFVLNS
jgi:hypothetical protein